LSLPYCVQLTYLAGGLRRIRERQIGTMYPKRLHDCKRLGASLGSERIKKLFYWAAAIGLLVEINLPFHTYVVYH